MAASAYAGHAIVFYLCRRGFTLRREGGNPPQTRALPPTFWLQQQYAVLKLANSYTGGIFEGRSGSFSNSACVLRATTNRRCTCVLCFLHHPTKSSVNQLRIARFCQNLVL